MVTKTISKPMNRSLRAAILLSDLFFFQLCSARNTKTIASAVSFGGIFSCEILDFGLQLSICVDGIIEGKATE